MKKVLILSTLLASYVSLLSQTNLIAIRNATVINVKNGTLIKNQTIIIEGNKITSVNNKVAVPKSATIVDAKGKYVLPGLWDMHAHAFTDRKFEWLFPLLIANGVTGVRDMASGASFDTINLIRNQVKEGKLLGPRFGAVTQKVFNAAVNPAYPSIAAPTPKVARDLVKLYKQNGMDFIKPYNQLSREVLLAIMDEAKLQGLQVGGHVPYEISAAEASDLGFVSIEHNTDILVSCSAIETDLRRELDTLPPNLAIGAAPRLEVEYKAIQKFDEKKAMELFKRFVRNGTSLCPTLAIPVRSVKTTDELAQDDRLKYLPKRFRDQWYNQMQQRNRSISPEKGKLLLEQRISIVGLMQRAGINILAGTDFMNPYVYPGFSLHDELELLVQGGLSPLQALQAATINGAKFFNREMEFGTVEKGKLADLVILDANPLEQITNTRKIYAVITNGRLLSRTDLDKLLSDVYNLQNK